MAPWFSIGFLGLLFAGGVYAFCHAVPDVYLSLQARSWPIVTGQINSSEVTEYRTSKGRKYVASVQYSYAVHGKKFDSGLVAFGYNGSQHRRPHDTIVAALPENTPVNVRYNPNDHQISVLSHGIHSGHKTVLMFFALWFSIIIAFLAMDLLSFYGGGTLVNNISKP